MGIDPTCIELVRSGLITYRQLNEVHRLVQETGGSFEDLLVSKGYLSKEQLAGRRRAPKRPKRKQLRLTDSLDLVKCGLLTFKQLNECHREARATRGEKTVVDVMVAKGYVSEVQLATIPKPAERTKHKKFSSSWDLFRAGAVSLKALNECHRYVKFDAPGKSLKEALVERGFITREQLADVERKKASGELRDERGTAASPFMEKYAKDLEGIEPELREELRREHEAAGAPAPAPRDEAIRPERKSRPAPRRAGPPSPAPPKPVSQEETDIRSARTFVGGDEDEEDKPGTIEEDVDIRSAQTFVGDEDDDDKPGEIEEDTDIRSAQTFVGGDDDETEENPEEEAEFRAARTFIGDEEEDEDKPGKIEEDVDIRSAQTFVGGDEDDDEPKEGEDVAFRAAQTFMDAGEPPEGEGPETKSSMEIRVAKTFMDVGESAELPGAPPKKPEDKSGGTFMDMAVGDAFAKGETQSGIMGPGMMMEGGGVSVEGKDVASASGFQKQPTQTGTEGDGATFMDLVDAPDAPGTKSGAGTKSGVGTKSGASGSGTEFDRKATKSTASAASGSTSVSGTSSASVKADSKGSSSAAAASSTEADAQAKKAKKKKEDEDAYSHPLVGKVIGGCRIVKKLGEGGMGAVFLAEHTKLKRQSVIKVVPAHLASNRQLIARFEREARAAAQVKHPNIVDVYNVGEENGVHYIEMEFVDGKALDSMLKDKKVLEQMECVRIIKDSCRALSEAHKNGVVHRDIKPDNIMMTRKGQVKIADFGLARTSSEDLELTKVGQILGTPAYMSPEQCQGKPTDHRCDIYSLGATFYCMITGKRPFTGTSVMEIMQKHIDEEPISPREYNPEIAVQVVKIILKMMAKKPDDRFQNADEVVAAIDQFMKEEGTEHLQEVQRALGDDYRLVKKLGQGGMGAVYSARAQVEKPRVKVGSLVALKVLNREVNQEEIARFEMEAKLALEIDHENIIRVLEFKISPDINYIVMEFVEGKSVRDIIRDEKKLPGKEAIRVFREGAKGLLAAHAKKIIHRDIKPDNIMLAKSGLVKIADFGIAKHAEAASELTQAGVVVGTPHYMSPEQCGGTAADVRVTTQADIYAFGATLYFMLTGQKPFEGETQATIIRQHLNTPPKPPKEIDVTLDESLSNVVLNMMAKKPKYRYATLEDVLHDLDAVEKGKRVKKHRNVDVPFEETGSKKAYLGVALVLSVAFLAAALLFRGDSTTKARREIQEAFTKGEESIVRSLASRQFREAERLTENLPQELASYDHTSGKQLALEYDTQIASLSQRVSREKGARDQRARDLWERGEKARKAAEAAKTREVPKDKDEQEKFFKRGGKFLEDATSCIRAYGSAYAVTEEAEASLYGDSDVIDRAAEARKNLVRDLTAYGLDRLDALRAYNKSAFIERYYFYWLADGLTNDWKHVWERMPLPGKGAEGKDRAVDLHDVSKAADDLLKEYGAGRDRDIPGKLEDCARACAEAMDKERSERMRAREQGRDFDYLRILPAYQEAKDKIVATGQAQRSAHASIVTDKLDELLKRRDDDATKKVDDAVEEAKKQARTGKPHSALELLERTKNEVKRFYAASDRALEALLVRLDESTGLVLKAADEGWRRERDRLDELAWRDRRFLEAEKGYLELAGNAEYVDELPTEGKKTIQQLARTELQELGPNLALLRSDGERSHMVPVAADGPFQVGSDDPHPYAANQHPMHWVTVQEVGAFCIDRTEVTVGQYVRFLKTDPKTGRPLKEGAALDLTLPHDPCPLFCHPNEPRTGHAPRELDLFKLAETAPDKPVAFASWYDAYAFAKWAGKRLPREVEWEKAAVWNPREKKAALYPWGDRWDANLLVCTKKGDEWPELPAVGSIPDGRSFYGALDMAGSVWEWTADDYKGYAGTDCQDPDFGSKFRVVRGGSFQDHRETAFRGCFRFRELPIDRKEKIGFRCVRAAE
ncbi:protein kinase [bacterium]|nr:protein kinase [bacterium]